jgi:hypothetical protein
MSFSAQWFSKSISKDNIDNNDINGESGLSVNSVNIVSRGDILKTEQWGDHAHLVEWFFSARDTLPRERFTYDQGDGWQVIWMTPVASYERLKTEIEKGPESPWADEVRSILKQLHRLFKNHRPGR